MDQGAYIATVECRLLITERLVEGTSGCVHKAKSKKSSVFLQQLRLLPDRNQNSKPRPSRFILLNTLYFSTVIQKYSRIFNSIHQPLFLNTAAG